MVSFDNLCCGSDAEVDVAADVDVAAGVLATLDRPYGAFIPRRFDTLRHVPAYANLFKERFERCLDLYMAPRATRQRLNIDPESLIPKYVAVVLQLNVERMLTVTVDVDHHVFFFTLFTALQTTGPERTSTVPDFTRHHLPWPHW